MDNKREELLKDNLWKLMLKLSIPGIVGMLVIGLYSFVDGIFVGKWVGDNALGAISVAYPFTLINNGIAVLIGIGSASVLSRAIGRNDSDTIEKIMGNLFLSVLILSSIVLILGMCFTKQIVSLSGAEGEILSYAVQYLKIIFIGSFFVNFAQSANMIIRGEGKMSTAMGIMAFGAILNIILDIVMIKFMNLGIKGAAIATIISQILHAIITFVYFKKFSKSLKLNKISLSFDIIPEVMSIGVSAMLMQVLSLVQQTLTYNVISKVGDQDSIILFGAIMRYMMFSFIPIWGMSQGFQPLAGINYGAKEYKRLKDATKVFSISGLILGLIFWVPFIFSTNSILSWFINNPKIIQDGITKARIVYIIFPLSAIMIMLLTLFQAVGDAKKAGLSVILRQILLFVPILYALSYSPLKDMGVFLTFPITDILVLILALIMTAKIFSTMSENKDHL